VSLLLWIVTSQENKIVRRRWLSSWMLCRVVWWKFTEISSELLAASIIALLRKGSNGSNGNGNDNDIY
jgi:hypothetical protein